MPPHDDNIITAYDVGDTITYDGTAATAAATTAATTATYTIHNTDNTATNMFNEVYNGAWDPLTHIPEFRSIYSVDTDTATNAVNRSNISLHVKDIKEQVEEEMDKYARKIYNLIKDLVELNVSEDEFVKLLKEGDVL